MVPQLMTAGVCLSRCCFTFSGGFGASASCSAVAAAAQQGNADVAATGRQNEEEHWQDPAVSAAEVRAGTLVLILLKKQE